MPSRPRVAVVSILVVLIGLMSAVLAQDQKGTLVVALDTLGAQTMDPILEGRAPHAHYQAPVFDSLAGFDYSRHPDWPTLLCRLGSRRSAPWGGAAA